MDVSYRTTLELDKIIARAVQLCTCAETKEMMRAIEPFATTEEERYALTQTNAINALLLKNGSPRFGAVHEVRRVVQIFRELRNGQTEDGKTKLKSPTGTMSTAEAISVLNSGMALAAHFGDGVLHARDVAASLVGAVVKDPVQDDLVWREYLETVVKERSDWKDLYRACREVD